MNGDRQTNRGLVVFSIILIGLGAFSGFYPLSILGLLFLIPAFLVPSRPPPRPEQKPQEPRRATPPPPRRDEPVQAQTQRYPPTTQVMQPAQQAQPMQPMSSPLETRIEVSPALFPTTMFPSVSPYIPMPTPPVEMKHEKQESRDELLEFAVLLAALKLFSS